MQTAFRDLNSSPDPKIMGIVNLTPDSFYDGGRYPNYASVVSDVRDKIKAGADWIDVGAQSTRPNSQPVSLTEELERLQVLNEVRSAFPDQLLSLDTYNSVVARNAIELYGVNMINDVSGLSDPEMISLINEFRIPYVLTFSENRLNRIKSEDQNPEELITRMLDFFKSMLSQLPEELIVLDPGFGFNKSLNDNFVILKYLERIKLLGRPILVGLSRKRMVYEPLNGYPTSALNGSTALHAIALWKGAGFLRVHDVKEACETRLLIQNLKRV